MSKDRHLLRHKYPGKRKSLQLAQMRTSGLDSGSAPADYGPTLAHWLEKHAMDDMPPPPGRSSHRVREKDVGAPPRCTDPSNPGAFQQSSGRMESHRRLLLHTAPNVALDAQPIPALRSLPAGYRAGTKGARPRLRSHWLRRYRLDKAALSSSRCAGLTAGLAMPRPPATWASQTTPAAPPPCPNLLLLFPQHRVPPSLHQHWLC